MIVTSTNSVSGKKITRYLNIVVGEMVIDAPALKSYLSTMTASSTKSRSRNKLGVIADARAKAIKRMIDEAGSLGADAVVGVKLEHRTVGQGMTMMVITYGTAVKLSSS